MRKFAGIIILLFVSIIALSADSKREMKASDYKFTKIEIDLYEVKDNIMPILDNIIEIVNTEQKYRDKQQGYFFRVTDDSKISIIAADYLSLSAYNKDACFYYRGYKFNYDGVFLDNFFIRKGKTTDWKIEYVTIKENSEIEYINIVGYEWCLWEYTLSSNGELYFTSFGEINEATVLNDVLN